MKDFSIDLETLGKNPGCSILEIACVHFDETGIRDSFDAVISLRSNYRFYLLAEEDTIRFWMTQPQEARERLFNNPNEMTLDNAISGLHSFLSKYGTPKDRRIWVRGLSFDIPILQEALKRISTVPEIWDFRNLHDVRTAIELFDLKKTENPNKHSALDDAIAQAQDVINAFTKKRLCASIG